MICVKHAVVKLSDDIMLAKQKVDQKLASLAEIQKEKISEVCDF